jgi:hypothetical protein
MGVMGITTSFPCVLGRLSQPPLLRSGVRPRTRHRGLPELLVREAAHHGRGVFAVGEEACSDGLAVYRVAEAVVPPREPCLSGPGTEAGGVVGACGPAVHRVAGLAPPGARAVGCLDGGADMCAQLWVSKSQVPGGRRRRSRAGRCRGPCPVSVPGQAVSIVRDIPHAHSNAALAA